MIYIQRIGGGLLETIDQFETRIEAIVMLAEYRLSDSYGIYYISTRCCKGWK
jgi:hypothetical protein